MCPGPGATWRTGGVPTLPDPAGAGLPIAIETPNPVQAVAGSGTLRASVATSWKSTRPQVSRMTSSRSPCSPVAASVHFPGQKSAGFASFQPDEHGPAGDVLDIPDQPVAAGTSTIREIISAHRLGLARETERQFAGLLRHGHAVRAATRSTGGPPPGTSNMPVSWPSVSTTARTLRLWSKVRWATLSASCSIETPAFTRSLWRGNIAGTG